MNAGSGKFIRKTLVYACLVFLACTLFSFAADFKWGRVKFEVKEKDTEDLWDKNMIYDTYFLEEVGRLTTLKVSTKVDVVPLNDLNIMTDYAILFMTASGTPVLTAKEKANVKEYLLRGGFILGDDCVDWRDEAITDKFYRGFKVLMEEIFPGKKMEDLPPEHPIYHAHFDLPKGLVCKGTNVGPGMGMHDDKGRLMVFSSCADLHCEWSTKNLKKDDTRTTSAYKMGINIIMYALTH